jgi:hypothetical protein
MNAGFRQAEATSVAVQQQQILVDLRPGFEDAALFIDLRGGRFARRDALVQQAPGDGRQPGAHRRAVSSREVALAPDHIHEDLVGLTEQLDDRRHLAVRVEALRPIGEREISLVASVQWAGEAATVDAAETSIASTATTSASKQQMKRIPDSLVSRVSYDDPAASTALDVGWS